MLITLKSQKASQQTIRNLFTNMTVMNPAKLDKADHNTRQHVTKPEKKFKKIITQPQIQKEVSR